MTTKRRSDGYDSRTLPIAIIGAGPVGLAAAAQLVSRGEIPDRPRSGRRGGRGRSPVGARSRVLAVALQRRPGCGRDADEGGVDRARPRSSADRPRARGRLPRAAGALPEIEPSLRLGTRVLSVSRRGVDKLRTAGRETAPFVLRLRTPAGEEEEILARAVIDASGTYGSPNPLGRGRDPARGEAGSGTASSTGFPTCWERIATLCRPAGGGRRERSLGAEHPPRPRGAAGRPQDRDRLDRPASARRACSAAASLTPCPRGARWGSRPAASGAWRGHARRRPDRRGRPARGRRDDPRRGRDTLAAVDELVAVTGFRPDLARSGSSASTSTRSWRRRGRWPR